MLDLTRGYSESLPTAIAPSDIPFTNARPAWRDIPGALPPAEYCRDMGDLLFECFRDDEGGLAALNAVIAEYPRIYPPTLIMLRYRAEHWWRRGI